MTGSFCMRAWETRMMDLRKSQRRKCWYIFGCLVESTLRAYRSANYSGCLRVSDWQPTGWCITLTNSPPQIHWATVKPTQKRPIWVIAELYCSYYGKTTQAQPAKTIQLPPSKLNLFSLKACILAVFKRTCVQGSRYLFNYIILCFSRFIILQLHRQEVHSRSVEL